MMNYQQAWAFLDNLQFFKIKLGLDSISLFLDDLGQPHRHLKFVHIAGTNGKGSVAVTLLTLLSQAGYRVGLYTSPHLSSVRERFRINDKFIGEEDFAQIASQIRDILNGRQITYFEFTTALALMWFSQQQVDLAIMEVGMGGRLDATNVIQPLVSVVTNVSMDHEAYLGSTLAEVAREKAGIIKKGVPVVSGVDDPVSREVVEQACQERGAPFYLLGRDFFVEPDSSDSWSYVPIKKKGPKFSSLTSNLFGKHQRGNTALALASIELLADAGFPLDASQIRDGLREVRWPGRLEYFCIADGETVQPDELKPAGTGIMGSAFYFRTSDQNEAHAKQFRRFLLDGAHNPAGVESLKDALLSEFHFDKLIVVWGSMADKDIAKTLTIIAPICDHLILTRPEGERSAEPERLRNALPEGHTGNVTCIRSVAEALRKAYELAGPGDLICVAGSLYLVGAVRQLLLGGLVD